MKTIATFADLKAHSYTLSGICRRCNTWRDIDPDAMPADMIFIGRRFKCADCGERREMILTPPRPDYKGR